MFATRDVRDFIEDLHADDRAPCEHLARTLRFFPAWAAARPQPWLHPLGQIGMRIDLLSSPRSKLVVETPANESCSELDYGLVIDDAVSLLTTKTTALLKPGGPLIRRAVRHAWALAG